MGAFDDAANRISAEILGGAEQWWYAAVCMDGRRPHFDEILRAGGFVDDNSAIFAAVQALQNWIQMRKTTPVGCHGGKRKS